VAGAAQVSHQQPLLVAGVGSVQAVVGQTVQRPPGRCERGHGIIGMRLVRAAA
jgi:hypothetical protein